MIWFQKDSLDTVSFRTYGGGSRVLNQKVTFEVLNVPMAEEQKPKTFRIATFYAQKLSGRSARNGFSLQT